MAKQTINQGTAPTGAGGDTFRSGSAKLQSNDDELYIQLGATAQGVLPPALPLSKGGTGATSAGAARTSLGLGTAAIYNISTSTKDKTLERVLKVGDFGLGIPIALYGSSDMKMETVAGNYSAPNGSLVNSPSGASAGYVQVEEYGAAGSFTRQEWKNLINQVHFFRSQIAAGSWTAWSYYLTSLNTTRDANGFIKAASPIVQLFDDRVELNDEAQLQDITFEKLSVGNYLIKGSSGFAQEGWYVETPKDANGNVLFSVIYTTLENGDISVKTYKKKFDFETVSIVADLENPVDITENRWIDLRLQELPQPEIEEPEWSAPPEFQPTGLAQAVATVMESYNDTE